MARVVMTGIKPQRLGREIAAALQAAYLAGCQDTRDTLLGVQCPGCPEGHLVPQDGPYQGRCARHWHEGRAGSYEGHG